MIWKSFTIYDYRYRNNNLVFCVLKQSIMDNLRKRRSLKIDKYIDMSKVSTRELSPVLTTNGFE